MIDIVLEIARTIVMIMIMVFLMSAGKKFGLSRQKGWTLILVGFGLLLFGTILDVTDNFEALNPLVVVGDTEVQAVLEKVVGYLFGFVVLFMGFWSWLPLAGAYLEAQGRLERFNAEVADLEATVAQRNRDLEESQLAVESGKQSDADRAAQMAKLQAAQDTLNKRRQELASKSEDLAASRYHAIVAKQATTSILDRLDSDIEPRLRDILSATKIVDNPATEAAEKKGQLMRIRLAGDSILNTLKDLRLVSISAPGEVRPLAAAE